MLSDEIRREILSRDSWKGKVRGERIEFRCPRHDDDTPSAWQGGGAWGCFTCGFQEPIPSLAGILGIMPNGNGSGYRLEDYADQKGLSVASLRSWGCDTVEEQGRTVVRIPYYDEAGSELRARFRSRTGKWWEGKNQPIYLYGRWRLVDAKQNDTVLIVEGESDCHALWSDGILAVGVPGATSWRPEWKHYLNDLDVAVWEEPDQGGAQMVERIVADFPKARVVHCTEAKDACELRQKLGSGFRGAIERLLAESKPFGAPEPPVAFDVLTPIRFELLLEEQLKPIDAVPTPFPGWNQQCRDDGGSRGLARGWHVLAAARTGVGKSILALCMAAAAIKAGETVCFLSLEMSQRQVEVRLMSILSGVPVMALEKGRNFDVNEFRRAALAFGNIPGRFITNRAPIHTVDQVVRSMKAMHEIHGARYFIVDYLQLAGNHNDPESITTVSHAVRQQAVDLRVITFGLSQFNRATSVLNETPTVHGLMGGSSLENDADQIVLVDHSKVQETSDERAWTTNLLLAKNRHGTTGAIPIEFSKTTLRMTELLPDQVPANLQGNA